MHDDDALDLDDNAAIECVKVEERCRDEHIILSYEITMILN